MESRKEDFDQISTTSSEKEYPEEEIQKAEEYKDKGNKFFQVFQYEQALDMYSEAIFCNVPPKKKAVYYCNRALVNLRCENYGIALFDSKDAIKNDPSYIKAYYRRGSAYVALGQLDLAVQDYKTVCKMIPNDKEARQKYELTMKEYKLREFAKCIGYDDKKVEVNLEDIVVESSYQGPRLENVDNITAEWVVQVMEYLKAQKVLHKKYALQIIVKCRDLFEKDKSLVHITIPDSSDITVCGDIHGQFYDLLNIFAINGNPSESNPYLFNGDFIDRGSFSVEVIMTLLAWKACFPKHLFMSRGNHESKNLNKLYGFESEVKHKYDTKTYDLFSDLFCYLPIAHCINKQVLVLHGGLFAKDGVTLQQIQAENRKREPGDEGIMCECLWSDPCDQDGRHPSKRGVGLQFGPDVAAKFLEENNLSK